MMHKPIQFKNICYSLPHKPCFEPFNQTISYGQRITVIGQNGSGKSTLLRMPQGLIEPTDGALMLPHDLVVGYVPQLINEFEPTNHLDRKNRQSLMRMLRSDHVIQVLKDYPGAMVVISHDTDFLESIQITSHYFIHNGLLMPKMEGL